MGWHEMLRDERAEGRAEGRAETLVEVILYALTRLGDVSDELRNKIMLETNCEALEEWYQLALASNSLEQFSNNM